MKRQGANADLLGRFLSENLKVSFFAVQPCETSSKSEGEQLVVRTQGRPGKQARKGEGGWKAAYCEREIAEDKKVIKR